MAFSFQATVDKYRDLIIDTQNYIWANPETGYREVKTGKYMEDAFEKLGYELIRAGDIPGFYTVIDTGRPGPEVLILGELDSLICADHPEADPKTGAAHVCGHSAQCAALIGIAAALREPGALDSLCGRIRLCAVPAEELIEIEYRKGLVEKGVIRYLGGKTEFLYRGYFDGVDIAFMVHTTSGENFVSLAGAVGCMSKRIVYKGVSAHAGGAPWKGVNALYAANLGLSAINSVRETFKEADRIRVHPIITNGGNAVNAIPDRVVLESYVRGYTFDAIHEANSKVNRALVGAALSLGANIDIQDSPGYGPLFNAPAMIDLAEDAAKAIPGVPFERSDDVSTGCTDMGDLSCIMPAIHPYAPGAVGTSHGSDYRIADPELACVASAKWQLEMLSLLLSENGERAKKIIDEFTPIFASKEEYFDCIDSFIRSGDCIEYGENGAVCRL
ncbi:MAG: amidohydrolase [Oscillospiraceae bacterium]|nr:amidohydrolase [Oscillospiraceae bacterium]